MDVLCSNVVKFGRREINEIVHYLRKTHVAGEFNCHIETEGVLKITGSHVHFKVSLNLKGWRGDATGKALDWRSTTGRGVKSYSGQKLRNNLGQVDHTYVPLSPSSIT